ncbi:MAG: four helix bundle protein [Thiohalocapsa sp. PB-PSB1]|nr:MAG: four helix bundle protein [Thiohalocapsa sp. PB-PSB1]
MNACAHLRRALQAIALNIAEGNGTATSGDRRRSFESARGSALECAAIQDVLTLVCEALSADDNSQQKALLDRLVAMLTELGQGGDAVSEELGGYRVGQFDTDADADSGSE